VSGRRKSRCGSALSQREAAVALGLSQYRYQEIEVGRRPEREILEVRERCLHGTDLDVLSAYELCLLARRRAKWALQRLANQFGVAHNTILKWECSGAQKLVDFWTSQGFLFPEARDYK